MQCFLDRLWIFFVLVALVVVSVFLLWRGGRPPPSSSTFYEHARSDDLSRRMLRSRDRAATARELGRLRPPDAVAFLVAYLSDADPEVRLACVEALAAIEDRTVVPDLKARLDREEHPDVKAALRRALEALSVEALARKLEKELASDDDAFRLAAVEKLGKIRFNDEAIRVLVAALSDEIEAVREAAAGHIARAGGHAFDRLKGAARSGDAATIRRVVAVLAKMHSSDTVPVLMSVLATAYRALGDNAECAALRASVIQAIVNLGQPATIPLVRTAFAFTDGPPMKEVAAEALERIGGPMAVFQIRTYALAWEDVPPEADLKLWLGVLDRVGGENARQTRRRIEQHVSRLRRRDILGPPAAELDAAIMAADDTETPEVDPENGIYTLVLDGALPGKRPLSIHLHRSGGSFRHAFGTSRSFNLASHTVNADDLKLEGGSPSGFVTVTVNPDPFRPKNRKPIPCAFELTTAVGPVDTLGAPKACNVKGVFEGTYGDAPVKGRILGLLQPRPVVPDPVWFHIALPGGLDGLHEHYWHNAWVSFLFAGGRTRDGLLTAHDQLAGLISHNITWSAAVSAVDATFDGNSLAAAVRADVESGRGPEISFGPHTFKLTGQVIGRVTGGTFEMYVEDTFIERAYFSGTVHSTVTYDPELQNTRMLLTLEGAWDAGAPLRLVLDRQNGEFSRVMRAIQGTPVQVDPADLAVRKPSFRVRCVSRGWTARAPRHHAPRTPSRST